jgi:hypothetical protein
MAYIIYRPQSSESARALTNALGGRRVVRPETLARLAPGNKIIFWGAHGAHRMAPDQVLNYQPLTNKVKDAEILTTAGVPTITFSRTLPPPSVVDLAQIAEPAIILAEDFINVTPSRQEPYRTALTAFREALERLQAGLDTSPDEWLPRAANHVGGTDLLAAAPLPFSPDYWAKKESITREFRIHSFKGRSIRAGMKIPRDGYQVCEDGLLPDIGNVQAHAWVRSHGGGWRISYDGDSIRQKHRDLAHAAVAALGLDFGAVDIAERADDSVFVLEVNRAPGIEAGTIDAYARAIREWGGE